MVGAPAPTAKPVEPITCATGLAARVGGRVLLGRAAIINLLIRRENEEPALRLPPVLQE